MKILLVCGPPVAAADNNVGGTHAVIGNLTTQFRELGHDVQLLTGEIFARMPDGCSPYKFVSGMLGALDFDHVHIVTQERLGLLVRRYMVEHRLRFTAAYHTQIPEYMKVRWGIPLWLGYLYMRWFCRKAETVIAPSDDTVRLLKRHGIDNAVACTHGVDCTRFTPGESVALRDLPKPLWGVVCRVTPEKNLPAFLDLDLPGTKVVIGDGTLLEELKARYPSAVFVGVQTGESLVEHIRALDCFVFPSLTDTFGLVNLEALACGIPVAAFPVAGAVLTDPQVACLDWSLRDAALRAVRLDGARCREFAENHSWRRSALRFLELQVACSSAQKIDRASHRLWCSLPLKLLEMVVDWTERKLFHDEPSGPYSKLGRNAKMQVMYDLALLSAVVDGPPGAHERISKYFQEGGDSPGVYVRLHRADTPEAICRHLTNDVPPLKLAWGHPDVKYRVFQREDERWFIPYDDTSPVGHVLLLRQEGYARTPTIDVFCQDEQHLGRTATRLLRQLLLRFAEAAGGIEGHGAALSRQGRGIVVAGEPGAGKTTLSLTLAATGRFDLVGSDKVALAPAGQRWQVMGIPVPWRVTPDTVQLIEKLRHYLEQPGRRLYRSDSFKDEKWQFVTAELQACFEADSAAAAPLAVILVLGRGKPGAGAIEELNGQDKILALRRSLCDQDELCFVTDWLGITELPDSGEYLRRAERLARSTAVLRVSRKQPNMLEQLAERLDQYICA